MQTKVEQLKLLQQNHKFSKIIQLKNKYKKQNF